MILITRVRAVLIGEYVFLICETISNLVKLNSYRRVFPPKFVKYVIFNGGKERLNFTNMEIVSQVVWETKKFPVSNTPGGGVNHLFL